MNIAVGIVLSVLAAIVALNFLWIVICCLSALKTGIQVLLNRSTVPAEKKIRLKVAQAT